MTRTSAAGLPGRADAAVRGAPSYDRDVPATSRHAASIRRWSRTEYDDLVTRGVFRGERVELVRGIIVEMSPQDPPHSAPIHKATLYLVRLLGDRADVRVQLPLALSDDSEPEPDLAIVATGEYADAHPTTASLVLEVAASSLAYDREKAEVYALARIPEYWILDVARRRIERYREPDGAGYRVRSVHDEGETLELVALPGVSISISALFPRRS